MLQTPSQNQVGRLAELVLALLLAGRGRGNSTTCSLVKWAYDSAYGIAENYRNSMGYALIVYIGIGYSNPYSLLTQFSIIPYRRPPILPYIYMAGCSIYSMYWTTISKFRRRVVANIRRSKTEVHK